MIIFIQNHNNKTHIVDVEFDLKIDSLISWIFYKEKIPKKYYYLTSGSKILRSGNKLNDYNINNDTTIRINLRLGSPLVD